MLNDEKKPPTPRVLCVFYSAHNFYEEALGEALGYSLALTEMGDGPFALVGPSRGDVWTRVWMDSGGRVRVSGGCFSGSLAETEAYGLNDDPIEGAEPEEEPNDDRQPDIIALIKDAAAWLIEASKKAA